MEHLEDTIESVLKKLLDISDKASQDEGLIKIDDPWDKTGGSEPDLTWSVSSQPLVNLNPSVYIYWLQKKKCNLQYPHKQGTTYYIGKAEHWNRIKNKMRSDYKNKENFRVKHPIMGNTVFRYFSLTYYLAYPTVLNVWALSLTKTELEIAEKIILAAHLLEYGMRPTCNTQHTTGPKGAWSVLNLPAPVCADLSRLAKKLRL